MPDKTEKPSNRHVFALFQWAPLPDVVDAVAAYVAECQIQADIWIGRQEDRWRWSFTTGGGPYPLLRNTAQYLHESHNEIAVHCAVTEEGVNYVGSRLPADQYAILSIAPGSAAPGIKALIENTFNTPQ